MSKFSSAAKSERKFLASKIVGRNREFSNAEGIFLNTLQRVGSKFWRLILLPDESNFIINL